MINLHNSIYNVNWLVCPKRLIRHGYICCNICYWYELGSFDYWHFVLLQSGSVIYKRAKLTGAQYKHQVIFTLDGSHRIIFTSDDGITLCNGCSRSEQVFEANTCTRHFSGLTGENLVKSSAQISWYKGGPTLLEAIDTFQPPQRLVEKPFRLSISDVYKVCFGTSPFVV